MIKFNVFMMQFFLNGWISEKLELLLLYPGKGRKRRRGGWGPGDVWFGWGVKEIV